MSNTYTNRAGKQVTLDFEISTYLKFIVDNPGMRLHRPPAEKDQPSVAKNFGLDYEQQAQMRESSEYKAAAEAFAAENNLNVDDLAIKDPVQQRETGTIKNADKATVGERVVMELERLAPAREDGKDGYPTTEWLTTNTDAVLDLVGNSVASGALIITEMPEKPAPKTPAETKAKLKEEVSKKEASLASAIKALHASGMDAAAIANSIPELEEANVIAILEADDQTSEEASE